MVGALFIKVNAQSNNKSSTTKRKNPADNVATTVPVF